jgi:hypothetical protein
MTVGAFGLRGLGVSCISLSTVVALIVYTTDVLRRNLCECQHFKILSVVFHSRRGHSTVKFCQKRSAGKGFYVALGGVGDAVCHLHSVPD